MRRSERLGAYALSAAALASEAADVTRYLA
jgi:hypothetical protein